MLACPSGEQGDIPVLTFFLVLIFHQLFFFFNFPTSQLSQREVHKLIVLEAKFQLQKVGPHPKLAKIH